VAEELRRVTARRDSIHHALMRVAQPPPRQSLAIVCLLWLLLTSVAFGGETTLWYDKPAADATSALRIGNGRIGATVYGGVGRELLKLNEDTIWSGNRSDYDRSGADAHLPEIRRLLFAEIRSQTGGPCTVRVGEKVLTLRTRAGEILSFGPTLERLDR
jgi:hypothetical protein